MKKSTKTIELKFERTIPASPSEVYDGVRGGVRRIRRRREEV